MWVREVRREWARESDAGCERVTYQSTVGDAQCSSATIVSTPSTSTLSPYLSMHLRSTSHPSSSSFATAL